MNDPTNSRYRYLNLKGVNSYRRFIQPENELKQYSINLEVHETPAHGTYGSLLFKPEWQAKRKEILKRDFNRCVICNGSDSLQVHHRQYQFIVRQNKFKLPWDYPHNLLITLCESCHKRGHNKFKVPTINI